MASKFNPHLEITTSTKPNPRIQNATDIEFWGFKSTADTKACYERLVLPADGGQFSFRKVNPAKNVLATTVGANGKMLKVTVANDKIDDFMKTGLQSIMNALIVSKNYDFDKIKNIEHFIFEEKPSAKEMQDIANQSDADILTMWTDYMNNLEDPETRAQLQLYAKIYGNTTYGHALSLQNVMAIRAQQAKHAEKPTFVLGKTKWKEYFNRAVKRGAKPYALTMYLPKWKPKPADVDKHIPEVQKDLGHDGTPFNELGSSVRDKIKMEAERRASAAIPKEKKVYAGYDVSDTILVNSNEPDPLTAKPGIKGNVIYTLNALAEELENKKNEESGNVIDPESNEAMKSRTQKALDAVVAYCDNLGITVPQPDGDPESSLTEVLLAYYRALATKKANVLTDKYINQYAEDATMFTYLLTNIGLNQLNRFHHSLTYTEKEVAALEPMMTKIASVIGNAIVQEGIGDSIHNKLMGIFNKLGIKIVPDAEAKPTNTNKPVENVVEATQRFYNMFNRIK
jgi:hypothetical protein